MRRRLHDLAARSAEREPDALAVCLGAESLTYEQLVTTSRRLARYLVDECGVERGDRVLLVAGKSPAAVMGMHAVLEAGGVYVPVDTASPAGRAAAVMTAAAPKAVLVRADGGRLVSELSALTCWRGCPAVTLEPGRAAPLPVVVRTDDWRALPAEALTRQGDAGDLAHLLFTSGSTGAPKGVQITHSNVLSFLDWALPHFGTTAQDRVSGHPPLHFDLSTFDVFGTLAVGASLHQVDPLTNLHPGALAQFIRDHALTQWFSVPSTMAYLAGAGVLEQDDFPELRRVLFCGEPMPVPVLRHWMRRLPHARFTNLYGPTEATIASTSYDVPAPPAEGAVSVPIGHPCAGEDALLLDEAGRPVLDGETGHLHLTGVGLSPGYWQDAAQTAAAFVPHATAPGERMYRTGDLARRDAEGLLHFVGREDSQIKHRGYRIELGEVEAALAALETVGEAAVTAVTTTDFVGTRICCAFVPADESVSVTSVRTALSRAVPSYMVPTQWRRLDALPRNQNGKIDRRALKEHFMAQEAAHA